MKVDILHDIVDILHYFPAWKSKDTKAQSCKIRISDIISSLTSRRKMLASIHLYDHLCGRAIEIHDVISDCLLPVELKSVELFAPNPGPQESLRICHVLPERASSVLELSVVVNHDDPSLKDQIPQSPFGKGGICA
jgi:hypothetical protein